MANAARNTVATIESLGGRQVPQPSRMHKNYILSGQEWAPEKRLLLAILSIPHGDYLKPVEHATTLRQLDDTPWDVTFMEVTEEMVKALKAHPRARQLLG